MQRSEAAGQAAERDNRDGRSAPAKGTDHADGAVRYEPPKLIRVGTLRNLLGKTGTVPDKGPPFELRD